MDSSKTTLDVTISSLHDHVPDGVGEGTLGGDASSRSRYEGVVLVVAW
jgi:hypothetical protein